MATKSQLGKTFPLALSFLILLLPGCLQRADICGVSGPPCADSQGNTCYVFPLPEKKIIFVNPLADPGQADGTMEHPYATIGDGVAAASPGDAVAIAAGTYGENVLVDKQVDLLGAGADRSIVFSDGDSETLTLAGISDVVVSGLLLKGDGGLGMLINNCHDISVTDVASAEHGEGTDYPGVGVYVFGSTGIELAGLDIRDNQVIGIAFSGSEATISSSNVESNGSGESSAGIVIDDGSNVQIGSSEPTADNEDDDRDVVEVADVPSATTEQGSDAPPESASEATEMGGCAITGTEGVGILVRQSVASINNSMVEGSEAGGIAFDGSPKAAAADRTVPPGSSLTAVTIKDSNVFGIAQFGGHLSVRDCRIESVDFPTVTGQGAAVAHGISVTENPDGPADITVESTEVTDCAGAGALLDGVSQGEAGSATSLLLNLLITETALSGIWVQSASRADVIGCTMDSVKLVGIAYTGDSQGLVYGNRFDSVDIGSKVEFDLGEEVEMADAIYLSGLKQPGAVAVQQNTIIQADRNGILVDDSHINALRYASTNDSGAQGSAFAGNSILPDAIGNGDEFAFQENCKGFDDKSVAELLSKGSSYVDPHDKSTLEQTPSTGKATLGTNWPTASDLSAAQ